MSRFGILIGVILLCCAFNICEKKVKTDGKVSRIYIYPDCNDTGTYLKQRYQAFHIVEYLYVHSKLKYKRIMDRNEVWIVNEFWYNEKNKETAKLDTFPGSPPDMSFDINDSCALSIEYFTDGGYHICTYGFNRQNECLHQDTHASSIVFDSLYKSKTIGDLQTICDSNSITDVLTNEDFVKIVHRERQVGKWYTVRDDGMRIDSVVYDVDK